MLFYEQIDSANAEGDKSGVSGTASGSSGGDAVVDETNGDPDAADLDAAESGGAVCSTGNKTTAAAEAADGEQDEQQEDGGGESASPEGQGKEQGEGVTSGATEVQEEKGESGTAAEEGGEGGPPNEEIWI